MDKETKRAYDKLDTIYLNTCTGREFILCSRCKLRSDCYASAGALAILERFFNRADSTQHQNGADTDA